MYSSAPQLRHLGDTDFSDGDTTAEGYPVTQQDVDDLAIIQAWVTYVLGQGERPTRMPSTLPNAGELAAALNGPGTAAADVGPTISYQLAPQDVRDADHRVNPNMAPEVAQIVPAPLPGEPLGTNLPYLPSWLKWVALGAIAFFVLPEVLPLLLARPRE